MLKLNFNKILILLKPLLGLLGLLLDLVVGLITGLVKRPGITTVIPGLLKFESTFFGWKLALGLLVCTP